MTTNASARARARTALLHAGLVTREFLDDLAELVVRRGLTDSSTEADLAAAVSRVRLDVPGPFEPTAPAEMGAAGAAEFRRRYPDANTELRPSDVALAQRRIRDAEQVRNALLAASLTGRAA